jgi:hypothetical protein
MYKYEELVEAFRARDLGRLRALAAGCPCDRQHELPWAFSMDMEDPLWADMMQEFMRTHALTVFFCSASMGFQWACEQGRLDMVRWLLACSDRYLDLHGCDYEHDVGRVVDLHADGDEAFRLALVNGHLEVAQWVSSIDTVNVPEEFVWSIMTTNYMRLDVLKWVIERFRIDIHDDGDAFFAACTQVGYDDALCTARWLLAQDPGWTQWPAEAMARLKQWSSPRDAWMRAVVHGCSH